ncbi:MAG: hypothetical protein COA45_12490 [Zetaproteobacteria bacterium]|nr:MAG: hypothetical protein COA45_12490 [Zetaproteobacteria bacterium]
MSKGADVLERNCMPAGKVFIRAGEENARAYVIQNGKVAAFTMDGDQKIEVEVFGPGAIIGEKCLILDEPAVLNFEVVEAATVIVITRQDFQKRLHKAGKSIKTVLDHAVQKLMHYESLEVSRALAQKDISDEAHQLVKGLLTDIPEEQRLPYEKNLLPHAHELMKALKEIKKDRAT